MKVLIAPDSFKGTMSARVVAEALAAGVVDGGSEAVVCPLADGGEGTAEVLLTVLGATRVTVDVDGPLGDPIGGWYARSGALAIIETATASGLHLVPHCNPQSALAASSVGTGQLMAAAFDAGATEILLGVGGSATTDGGAGALSALGEHLSRLTSVRVLCDVRTTYERAAEVYGPFPAHWDPKLRIPRGQVVAAASIVSPKY